MKVNPLNVINLLLAYFQNLNIQESPHNVKEIEIKDHFQMILLDLMDSSDNIDIIMEESLDFLEEFKEPRAHIVEDIDLHSLPDDPEPPTDQCISDDEPVSFEYKTKAVEYWRSSKKRKNLSLETVQNKFRKVTSERQLRRWAHQINQGGTYREKIARIGYEDIRFKASKFWLSKFKKAHKIVSRKINKFITKTNIENRDNLQKNAREFVTEVKQLINEIGVENTYNSDQSGFQLEMHSGRTLAIEGEKQVQCLVQSISSTTHSYTVQPTISADGKLLSPLFLVLKEPSGEFGPVVSQTLFRPTNVYAVPSKSGKLTSGKIIFHELLNVC